MGKTPAGGAEGFHVYIDDNAHHGDEAERRHEGAFDEEGKAVERCREIVERSLRELHVEGMSGAELFRMYELYGEDPWISPGEFSAHDYAKRRSDEICRRPA